MAKSDPELDRLAGVALFAGCSRDDLAAVRKLMREERFEPGTAVVTEGEPASRFHLITSGSASVYRRGAHVHDLGPGDYFGEMALVLESTRSATVVANGELATLALAPFNFRPLLKHNGPLTYNILVNVSQRLHDLEVTPPA